MPRVRWDYGDFEDLDEQLRESRFQKIKSDKRQPSQEEEYSPKKKSGTKHSPRPGKD